MSLKKIKGIWEVKDYEDPINRGHIYSFVYSRNIHWALGTTGYSDPGGKVMGEKRKQAKIPALIELTFQWGKQIVNKINN